MRYQSISKFFGLQDGVETPQEEKAIFLLRHNVLEIGFLILNEGSWSFLYSDDFKQQNEIKPIVEFSDVDKVYTSSALWPFFTLRIPSLSQPSVRKILQKEDIDQSNEVSLLKRFGKQTIANPYYLKDISGNQDISSLTL